MLYQKSEMNKEAFRINAFKKFTDACGGSDKEFTDILYCKYTVEDFAYGDDMYYWGVLKYFTDVVIPHKIAVYQAGLELSRQEWFKTFMGQQDKEDFLYNLWVHDMSKFSANEAFGYAMYNRKTGHGKEGFEAAWHHHKMNNPHHPEYWFNPNRSGQLEPIAMPNIYIMEMITDWIGAGKTYGSTLEQWLPDNIHKFRFGAKKGMVIDILKQIGIRTWIHEGGILQTTEKDAIITKP